LKLNQHIVENPVEKRLKSG